MGVELITDEIQKRYPEHFVQRLDADSVKTNSQATAIVKSFYDTPGSILVVTEMALLYLDQKVENVAIASIDSMFGLPDFRVREKILSILIRLRSLAIKKFLVQTRNIEEPVFNFAEQGNLIEFYKQEFEDRKAFDYPPFTVLIKISLSGNREDVKAAMFALKEDLKDYAVSLYPAFVPFSKGVYTMHALIKIGQNRWVDTVLYEKLRTLPPSYAIAVDPENIL